MIDEVLDRVKTDDIDAIEHDLLEALIKKARNDFFTFVKLLAPTILPEEFTPGHHIKLICKELQDVAHSVTDKTRDPKRLQIFLPPGSMKSKLSSNLFPAWCLGRHPNWCFLAMGSDFEFAVDNFGRPTKDIIDSEVYKTIFPNTILHKDVQAAGRWDTTKKGRFVARGAGQNIAGRRAHIAICDDVMTEQTTDTERKKINKWYQQGLRTRLLPRGAEIIINTRWHIMDLSGYMLKVDGQTNVNEKTKRPWTVIKVPAIVDKEASEWLRKDLKVDDHRFEIGTSFWPEFWPTSRLLSMKETFDPSEWNALYMQSPIPDEGGIVKRAHFNIWNESDPPPCKYILISMDTAYSKSDSADYSAYTIWGIFDKEVETLNGTEMTNCMIMLSAGRGKWDLAELCTKAQELNEQYTSDFVIIEDKASGQSLIPELRKRGLPVVTYTPTRDKMFRLQSTTPYFQAQRIWIPKEKHWAQEVVDEVCAFPKAPHDDMTDTVSQAVLWMRDQMLLDNDGFQNHRDDEDFRPQRRASYWSSAVSRNA